MQRNRWVRIIGAGLILSSTVAIPLVIYARGTALPDSEGAAPHTLKKPALRLAQNDGPGFAAASGLTQPVTSASETPITELLDVRCPSTAEVNVPILIEIAARNPAEEKRIGTIALSFRGVPPTIPSDPTNYDLITAQSVKPVTVFERQGDEWLPRTDPTTIRDTLVEVYRPEWEGCGHPDAAHTLRIPVVFHHEGKARLYMRATFALRSTAGVRVTHNLPAEGLLDQQGLPCLVKEIEVKTAASGAALSGQETNASPGPGPEVVQAQETAKVEVTEEAPGADALSCFRAEAVKNPNDAAVLYGLACVQYNGGMTADAVATLRKAVALSSNHTAAKRLLVALLNEQACQAQAVEAVSLLSNALEVPGIPKEEQYVLLVNRAFAKADSNDSSWKEDLKAALRLAPEKTSEPNEYLKLEFAVPGNSMAQYELGRKYSGEKNYAKAIEWYQYAADQGMPTAQNSLAWLCATSKDERFLDGKKAVAYAQKAILTCETEDRWFVVDTLAAAYARDGQFDKAVETQREAIALVTAATHLSRGTKESAIEDFKSKLDMYTQGIAFVDDPEQQAKMRAERIEALRRDISGRWKIEQNSFLNEVVISITMTGSNVKLTWPENGGTRKGTFRDGCLRFEDVSTDDQTGNYDQAERKFLSSHFMRYTYTFTGQIDESGRILQITARSKTESRTRWTAEALATRDADIIAEHDKWVEVSSDQDTFRMLRVE